MARLPATPLIIACDPGEKRGYALVDPRQPWTRAKLIAPRVIAVGTKPGPLLLLAHSMSVAQNIARPIWTIGEFQYAQRVSGGEISAESIIKLAFRAGYMLRDMATPFQIAEDPMGGAIMRDYDIDRQFAATPQWWKPEIGDPNLRKDIFCERVKRQLTTEELELLRAVPLTHTEDVLDAIGIAWALSAYANRGGDLSLWEVDGDGRIIPKGPPRRANRIPPVKDYKPSLMGKQAAKARAPRGSLQAPTAQSAAPQSHTGDDAGESNDQ